MIKITDLPNPYDFSNPIESSERLFGRETLLEEVEYYLTHAIKSHRPINIAFIGSRAAGKTSLLNITEIEANKKDFLTVRIDLDESDAQKELFFFFKIFDSIILKVCEEGGYEGLDGKTFDTYLDMISNYNIPSSKISCPFIFPIQYAKAMSANNSSALTSPNIFKRDLQTISTHIKKPILLLFDECDVLSKSRIHLEKIRNIFMNLKGYMLVLSGTEELFPMINDIFSPMIRQFQKLEVKEFENKDDTEKCVITPLEIAGIENLDELFQYSKQSVIDEIHDISGGKPYEIQLICHNLFKRIQKKQSKYMKIDLAVLESVRKTLEDSENINLRPNVQYLKSLSDQQLKSLSIFTMFGHGALYEDIITFIKVFRSKIDSKIDILISDYHKFMNDGILIKRGKMIKYSGDDFDKIYFKYYARERKIFLRIREAPTAVIFNIELDSIISMNLKGHTFFHLVGIDSGPDWMKLIQGLNHPQDDFDVFKEYSNNLLYQFYLQLLKFSNVKTFTIYSATFNHKTLQNHIYFTLDGRTQKKSAMGINKYFSKINNRLSKFNTEIELKEISIQSIKPLKFVKLLANSDNQELQNRFRNKHKLEFAHSYVTKKASQRIELNKKIIGILDKVLDMDSSTSNNLAYFYLQEGKLEKAKKLFVKILKNSSEPHELYLIKYNLCIAELKLGNPKKALSYVNESISVTSELNIEERSAGCLIIPKIKKGNIIYTEIFMPNCDIHDSGLLAKKCIETIIKKK